MLVAKKIRILVSQQDAETLEFMQSKSRGLYNWWLSKLKAGEKWNFVQAKRTLKASREYDPELNDVYGMLLAEVYFRLDRAMQAFFRRVKKVEKPGFPRFRPRHKFFSLVYPGRYIKLKGNKVILPTGGKGKNKNYPCVEAVLTEKSPREAGLGSTNLLPTSKSQEFAAAVPGMIAKLKLPLWVFKVLSEGYRLCKSASIRLKRGALHNENMN